MLTFSALTATAILIGLALFQVALILGAPLGKYAWGGANVVLPTKLRIASATSIMLYGAFAVVILSKASIITVISDQSLLNVGMWVLVAYFFVGILMNAISRSKTERNIMTPVAAALALLFLIAVLS